MTKSPSHRGPVIVLFRRDLRVEDNGALSAAAETGRPVLPLFILDGEGEAIRQTGAAALWWLHHSLHALQRRLRQRGVGLTIRRGPAVAAIPELVGKARAASVYWNRRHDPAGARADEILAATLGEAGCETRSFDGQLLHEPDQLRTAGGSFYKVYTPFWRALGAGLDPRDPHPAPDRLEPWPEPITSLAIDEVAPLPRKPDWAAGFSQEWQPGEDAAHRRLHDFLDQAVDAYQTGRDRPGEEATSRLSPHLAFGEITPFQIMRELRRRHGAAGSAGAAAFEKELGWREFCHHILNHCPRLHEENFQPSFDAFPWRADADGLRAWRAGATGYPIVDAGMRQLWRTGWMHNRVRMVVASFLVKHLLIDWRQGERWFWDTLVDADVANNPANWQWVAGSGADAAPYFRIFNPVLQGEKFDANGDYVRRYVPEIAALPDRYLHKPWLAPDAIRAKAGIKLGTTYPRPIVDHAHARERALAAYRRTRREP